LLLDSEADAMADGLATVAFLANSENRARVLLTLAEEPRGRAALRAETGTTRATLARVLGELDERGLIRQEAETYALTPAGRALVEAFRPLVRTAAALDTLGDLAAWFPFDDVGFDVRHLHDARVVRPTKADAIRPVNRSLELIDGADRIRVVASQHAPPALAAFREGVDAGRLQLDMVVTREVLEAFTRSERDTDHLRRLVDSSRASVAVTDAPLDYNAAANDDTIVLTVSDDGGAPQVIIETDAPAVADWFDGFFERHRAAATPVTPADVDD
jgi:predicted transcriptional regulator